MVATFRARCVSNNVTSWHSIPSSNMSRDRALLRHHVTHVDQPPHYSSTKRQSDVRQEAPDE